ncbi:MAG: tetratricopeptide repeat protein [bacterium]|nr:tetratricopeptide repeat protein [bacterium]
MSDQINPKAEKSQEMQAAAASGKPAPQQLHGRYVELFAESLAKEGEKTYARWGLAMFHSLSDEQVMAQRRALGFKPVDSLDHYNLGCSLAAEAKYEKAVDSFRKAIELRPDFAEAAYNLAMALELAGDKSAARKAWQAYLDRFAADEETTEIKQRLVALADA